MSAVREGERPEAGPAGAPPRARVAASHPLLALQGAAGNRAVGRVLARRELSGYADGSLTGGDWSPADRRANNQRWKDACEFNLVNGRNGEYTHIWERRDFYKWFYEATVARGYETRWAIAAYVVAAGMEDMTSVEASENLSPITNELQRVARIGNQVIFDDVLPKLRAIWLGPILTGTAARLKDEQVLAEEQVMIQHLYDATDADTRTRFRRLANQEYTRANIGSALGLGGHTAGGSRFRELDTPSFSSLVPGGDINTPEDRWRYGMALAGAVSTLPSYGAPSAHMPGVGADYASGAQFRRLNVRPNLHGLDAWLGDNNVAEAEMVTYIQHLSAREQRELAGDATRVQRLWNTLDLGEMRDAIQDLPEIRLEIKLNLLLGSTGGSDWSDLGYSDVGGMIRLAWTTHPAWVEQLRGDEWRRRFIAICDDTTIATAVVDLHLPADVAADWIARERS